MSKTSMAKKSLIAGALVGTGGMFVAKLIGLLYSIPLSYILGSSSYMAIYGTSYNIYSYFLTIFQSGIPFAVAALVARYMTKENYRSVLLLKRISFIILAFTGFIGMMILFLISGWLAPLMVGENVKIMSLALKILSISVFLVPLLVSFRGYYQGLKEMEEYAFSQSFEQLVRVGFLLIGACLSVYVFDMERKWALYIAVFSTCVATIAAIWQIARFDTRQKHKIVELANTQTMPTYSAKQIIQEMIPLAIPFFVAAILGNIDQVFQSLLMPWGLDLHQYSIQQKDVIIGTATFAGAKLESIPMILGPGFATAIIPHITSALTQKNYKLVNKHIKDCLNIVCYIALPVSFCIFAYAGPICNTLYYTSDIALSTTITQWISISAFLSTLSLLVTNLMLSLEFRKKSLLYLLCGTIVKGVSLPILTMFFGYPGVVMSFTLGTCLILFLSLRAIQSRYHVSLRKTGILLVKMGIGILALWVTCILLTKLGLNGLEGSKLMAFIKMGINALISLLVYVLVTLALRVPQSVFHIQLSNRLKRG